MVLLFVRLDIMMIWLFVWGKYVMPSALTFTETMLDRYVCFHAYASELRFLVIFSIIFYTCVFTYGLDKFLTGVIIGSNKR
jgi:hypothetical protein